MKRSGSMWVRDEDEFTANIFDRTGDQFEIEHLEAALHYVGKRRVALDVGANYGSWTRYLAKNFERVLAFEPVAETHACLQRNVQHLPNVEIRNEAVGKTAGSVTVGVGKMYTHPGMETILGDGPIKMVAIDDLDLPALDFLKIDVEGYELFVLQGAEQTLLRHRPVIILEENIRGPLEHDIENGECDRYLASLGAQFIGAKNKDLIFAWDNRGDREKGFAVAGFDQDFFVRNTLAEDLGTHGDITSAAIIPDDAVFTGVMNSRDAITVAGLPLAAAFFRALDPSVEIEILVDEGAQVAAGTTLMQLRGRASAMLTAERSALNTAQHLSGIATMTRTYVDAVAGSGAKILDTRKTIPGLRFLEKYATKKGGALNHRIGLWEGAMIKDNHIAIAGDVGTAVSRAVAAGITWIIVEVDRIDQIEPALAAGATHLLLDNMDPATLREAVKLVGGRVPTEASGGVRLETIREIAETGVNYVSVGRLTQSAPAVDIGLDFALA